MLSFLRRARPFVAFATLAVLPAIPAHAASFGIQGLFGNTIFNGPLNGGSFTGTFNVTGLPVANGSQVLLTSWNVTLLSASHTVLANLTTANGCPGCGNVDGRFAPASGDILNFGDTAGDFLELQFAAPFNGIGSAIPFTAAIGSFASFAGIGGNSGASDSIVLSASSSAVPEPSTALFLAVGLGLIGSLRARRAVTHTR